MDDFDGFGDDMADGFDDGDREETVMLMDSARPLKRSRTEDGEGPEPDDGVVEGVEVWQRPPLPPLSPDVHPIVFQWMSIDIVGGEPLKSNPAPGRGVAGSKNAPVPVLHVYGVMDSGHSVLCRVHGFTPYFYFGAPAGMTRGHLPGVKDHLEQLVRLGGPWPHPPRARPPGNPSFALPLTAYAPSACARPGVGPLPP